MACKFVWVRLDLYETEVVENLKVCEVCILTKKDRKMRFSFQNTRRKAINQIASDHDAMTPVFSGDQSLEL